MCDGLAVSVGEKPTAVQIALHGGGVSQRKLEDPY